MNCQKCGNKLREPDGPGRPRKFCSKACRRAGEYEVTRINRRIGALEEKLSYYRMMVSARDRTYIMEYDCPPRKAIKIVEKEIKLQEKRLLQLMEEDEK